MEENPEETPSNEYVFQEEEDDETVVNAQETISAAMRLADNLCSRGRLPNVFIRHIRHMALNLPEPPTGEEEQEYSGSDDDIPPDGSAPPTPEVGPEAALEERPVAVVVPVPAVPFVRRPILRDSTQGVARVPAASKSPSAMQSPITTLGGKPVATIRPYIPEAPAEAEEQQIDDSILGEAWGWQTEIPPNIQAALNEAMTIDDHRLTERDYWRGDFMTVSPASPLFTPDSAYGDAAGTIRRRANTGSATRRGYIRSPPHSSPIPYGYRATGAIPRRPSPPGITSSPRTSPDSSYGSLPRTPSRRRLWVASPDTDAVTSPWAGEPLATALSPGSIFGSLGTESGSIPCVFSPAGSLRRESPGGEAMAAYSPSPRGTIDSGGSRVTGSTTPWRRLPNNENLNESWGVSSWAGPQPSRSPGRSRRPHTLGSIRYVLYPDSSLRRESPGGEDMAAYSPSPRGTIDSGGSRVTGTYPVLPVPIHEFSIGEWISDMTPTSPGNIFAGISRPDTSGSIPWMSTPEHSLRTASWGRPSSIRSSSTPGSRGSSTTPWRRLPTNENLNESFGVSSWAGPQRSRSYSPGRSRRPHTLGSIRYVLYPDSSLRRESPGGEAMAAYSPSPRGTIDSGGSRVTGTSSVLLVPERVFSFGEWMTDMTPPSPGNIFAGISRPDTSGSIPWMSTPENSLRIASRGRPSSIRSSSTPGSRGSSATPWRRLPNNENLNESWEVSSWAGPQRSRSYSPGRSRRPHTHSGIGFKPTINSSNISGSSGRQSSTASRQSPLHSLDISGISAQSSVATPWRRIGNLLNGSWGVSSWAGPQRFRSYSPNNSRRRQTVSG